MTGRLIPDVDLLLPPGLIHLQTGGVGAMPRPVFDATVTAMTAVESDPVGETYGPGIGTARQGSWEGSRPARLQA